MPILRYPGSKEKLWRRISASFPSAVMDPLISHVERLTYYEPFFGAGAIGFKAFEGLSRDVPVRVSDADPAIVAFWQCVKDRPRDLCRRVREAVPNSEDWHRYKADDGMLTGDAVEDAFRKLALHRWSYSGLGAMAGGPLGGKDQENAEYPIGCRWTVPSICKEIGESHGLLRQFRDLRIGQRNALELLPRLQPESFVYLDPPYYEQGPALYKHSMSDEDHALLAEILSRAPYQWALSYDDHPRIRELYGWARQETVIVKYTTANTKGSPNRQQRSELLILPVQKLDRA